MLDSGNLFVTELPPDSPPLSGHFPMRNRIIAGMSQATIVVEAAEKSGTFITANFALDGGRLVCAVPGPITSRYSDGTTKLIQQGATLINNGYEVISELKQSYPDSWGFIKRTDDKDKNKGRKVISTEQKIYDMLMAQPLSSEKLGHQLELPVVKLNTLLTELELSGMIVRRGSSWIVSAHNKKAG